MYYNYVTLFFLFGRLQGLIPVTDPKTFSSGGTIYNFFTKKHI